MQAKKPPLLSVCWRACPSYRAGLSCAADAVRTRRYPAGFWGVRVSAFPEILWENSAASANQIEPLSRLPAELRGNISEY